MFLADWKSITHTSGINWTQNRLPFQNWLGQSRVIPGKVLLLEIWVEKSKKFFEVLFAISQRLDPDCCFRIRIENRKFITLANFGMGNTNWGLDLSLVDVKGHYLDHRIFGVFHYFHSISRGLWNLWISTSITFARLHSVSRLNLWSILTRVSSLLRNSSLSF